MIVYPGNLSRRENRRGDIQMTIICFFNIYDKPWRKIAAFLFLIGLRMGMFAYTMDSG